MGLPASYRSGYWSGVPPMSLATTPFPTAAERPSEGRKRPQAKLHCREGTSECHVMVRLWVCGVCLPAIVQGALQPSVLGRLFEPSRRVDLKRLFPECGQSRG